MQKVCENDSDCSWLYKCDEESKICIHTNDLDTPINLLYVIGWGIALLTVGIINTAGLGAGQLKFPVLLMILNYSLIEATKLSYPILSGGALGNFIYLFYLTHPNFDLPLIDYDILLIMTPFVLFGTSLGLFISYQIPLLYQIILGVAVCIVTFYFSYNQLYKRVKRNLYGEKLKSIESESDEDLILHAEKKHKGPNIIKKHKINIQETQSNEQHLIPKANLYQYQSRRVDVQKLIYIFVVFALFLGIDLVKGSYFLRSLTGIQLCSTSYYVTMGAQFVAMLACVILIRIILRKELQRKQTAIEEDQQNVKQTQFNFYSTVFISLVASFLEGSIGIGQGFIVIFWLNFIGVHSKISVATSTLLKVLISTTYFIEMMVNQSNQGISWEDSVIYFSISFVGSLVVSRYICSKLRDYYTMIKLLIFFSIFSFIAILGYLVQVIFIYGIDASVKIQISCTQF